MEELQKVSKNIGKLVTSALRFVLQHPAVASAVVGIRTEEQLKEIVASMNVSVSNSELETLASVLEPKVYEAHR